PAGGVQSRGQLLAQLGRADQRPINGGPDTQQPADQLAHVGPQAAHPPRPHVDGQPQRARLLPLLPVLHVVSFYSVPADSCATAWGPGGKSSAPPASVGSRWRLT